MIDAAKRASARHIIAVMPYFGWARQDRKVVRVWESALYKEDILTTNTLLVRNDKFAVREAGHHQVTKRTAKAGADFLSKVSRLCTREYQKRVIFTHFFLLFILITYKSL